MRFGMGWFLCFVVACNGVDEDTGTDELDTGEQVVINYDFEPLRDMIEEELEAFGAPGAAVAISYNGQVIFSEGFGYKDPDNIDPMEDDTLLRIGSVTKMMTAAAVLRQVDLGAMDLSDSFSTYVPELEFNKDPGITDDILLHHLISHQAALADNTPVNGGAADSILETYALDVYAKYYFTMAPPGAMFNYSNPNFGFAGLALERASGRSYREEVVEEVFKPLGMDRSFFLGEEVLADGNYATARTLNYWSGLIPKEETVGPDSYDDAFSRPAGFAWASVGDLLRFADFAMNGNTDLMSLERSSELMTRQVNTHQFLDVDHYGYGWMIWDGTYTLEGEWLPATIARHNGVIPGYSADLYAVPDHDFAVAILANSDGAYLGESFMTALDIVLGEVLPATTTDPLSLVDPVPLETYEGTYFDAQNVGEIVVTMEGDALKAHIPTLDSIGYPYDPTLIYISPGNFWQVLDGFGTLVTFVPSGEADSAYFRTRYYVGTSTELAEPDSAAAPNPTRFMKALRHPLTPSASNFLYQENYMLGSVVH